MRNTGRARARAAAPREDRGCDASKRQRLGTSGQQPVNQLPARSWRFTRCLLTMAAFLILGGATWPGAARAQQHPPPTGCVWGGGSVPVYMNPGTLAANGLDVDEARDALRAALALWNEETTANVQLYYAGDVAWTGEHPGSLLVVFQDHWGEHLDGRPYPASTLWPLDPDGSYYEDMEHRRHCMRGPPELHPIHVATNVWSAVALFVEDGDPGLVRDMYPVEADPLVIGTVRVSRADLVSAVAAAESGGAR